MIPLLLLAAMAAGAYVLFRRRTAAARIARRLQRYARAEALALAPSLPERPTRSTTDRIADAVALRVERAHLPLRPREYTLLLLASGATAALVGFLVRGPGGALVLAAGAVWVLWTWPARVAERARRDFLAQLPGALSAMAGALRAGQSLPQAIRIVAEEFPDPVGPEFARAARAMQLGQTASEAVRGIRRRVDADEVSYLEAAIALHQQTGADLGYILERTVEALRTRMEAEAEMRALTSQARFSATVLTGIPIVVGAALYVIDRDYGPTMLGTPAGRTVVAVSALLVLIGRRIMRRITEVL